MPMPPSPSGVEMAAIVSLYMMFRRVEGCCPALLDLLDLEEDLSRRGDNLHHIALVLVEDSLTQGESIDILPLAGLASFLVARV